MKKILFSVVLLSGIAFAEFYKLSNLKRIEQNLYKYDGGYVSTKYCYEYTYGEDVIFNDKTEEIIFSNGSKCQVDKFYR